MIYPGLKDMERNVLFDDALNTFYLWLYGIGYPDLRERERERERGGGGKGENNEWKRKKVSVKDWRL